MTITAINVVTHHPDCTDQRHDEGDDCILSTWQHDGATLTATSNPANEIPLLAEVFWAATIVDAADLDAALATLAEMTQRIEALRAVTR